VAWHANRRPPRAMAPFVEAAAEICDGLARQWSERLAASPAARGSA
jgi:hypothetical protein